MTDANQRVLDGLKKAIDAEGDGNQFYLMAARGTSDEQGRKVFEQLAREEVEHANFLKAQYRSILTEGRADLTRKLGPRSDLGGDHPIFSEGLEARAEEADFERSALSIGCQLEANAIQFYQAEAKAAEDPDVKAFYGELVEWERGHYDALSRELEALRQDHWDAGGFAPF